MPYRVGYYVHEFGSNYPDSPREKYCNILLQEEAECRAKALLKQLKAYYNKHLSHNCYTVETFVLDNEHNIVLKQYK